MHVYFLVKRERESLGNRERNKNRERKSDLFPYKHVKQLDYNFLTADYV